jgi:hypothetical protein
MCDDSYGSPDAAARATTFHGRLTSLSLDVLKPFIQAMTVEQPGHWSRIVKND